MKNRRFFNPRMRLAIWRVRRRNAKAMRPQPQKKRATLPRLQWTDRQRGLFYFFALGTCAAMAIAAGIASYVVHVHQLEPLEFELLDAQGNPIIAQELIVLDPYHHSETTLLPGETMPRPIALVNTHTQPVLLRLRVEETALVRRRCDQGELLTTMRQQNLPSDLHTPHTVTQQQAQRMLVEAGFTTGGTAWTHILDARLPAARLPNQSDNGGRLLVWELISIDDDALDPELPDLSALRPEDLYALGLGITQHEFMGFYLHPQDDGSLLYQPLEIVTQQNAYAIPTISQILYEYVVWDVLQHDVHLFGQEDNPVQMQHSAALHPLTAFTTAEDAWFFDHDGWVYYGMVLAPGVMTPVLIEGYALHQSHTSDLRYRIHLEVQPVQPQYAIAYWGSGATLNFGENSTTAAARRMIRNMIP